LDVHPAGPADLEGEKGQESSGPLGANPAVSGDGRSTGATLWSREVTGALGSARSLVCRLTAGEQRTPRGVTAGRAGKALKARSLWVDVARNKATR
jgi:hypothetical protein